MKNKKSLLLESVCVCVYVGAPKYARPVEEEEEKRRKRLTCLCGLRTISCSPCFLKFFVLHYVQSSLQSRSMRCASMGQFAWTRRCG